MSTSKYYNKHLAETLDILRYYIREAIEVGWRYHIRETMENVFVNRKIGQALIEN